MKYIKKEIFSCLECPHFSDKVRLYKGEYKTIFKCDLSKRNFSDKELKDIEENKIPKWCKLED